MLTSRLQEDLVPELFLPSELYSSLKVTYRGVGRPQNVLGTPKFRGPAYPPRREVSTSSRSSGRFKTSRALEPSLGPTIPLLSSKSMSRPAFAKPTRSLRCSMDVEPNWLRSEEQ